MGCHPATFFYFCLPSFLIDWITLVIRPPKIRAEQAAKWKKWERYQELMAEAAEKRREFAELQYHNLLMAGAFQKTDLEW